MRLLASLAVAVLSVVGHVSATAHSSTGAASSTIDPLLATTECGLAKGAWVDVPSFPDALTTSRVALWASIPYAAAPTDNLRWAAPASPTCWKGTFDATAFRNYCVQPGGDGDEDCLDLHVYVDETTATAVATAAAAGKKIASPRPVWVYIHGGSLMSGSGLWEPLAPFASHAKAANGESVIVVSMNYRLNMFGFLSVKEFSDVAGSNAPAANFGLMDQQAALRWVKRNIAKFGGDASRVTLGGQSSGGTSIFAHYSSANSRGLFSGAIAISGSINMSMTIKQGQTQNAAIPAALSCSKKTSALTVKCLRALNTTQLVAGIPNCWNTPGLFGIDLLTPAGMNYCGLPLIDGLTINMGFGDALAAGYVDVPLLVGNSGQEADLGPDVDFTSYTQAEFKAYLVTALASFPKHAALAATIYDIYKVADNGTLAVPEYAGNAFNADYSLTCGLVELATAAKKGSFKSNIYTFLSQWAPSTPNPNFAYHTADYGAAIENFWFTTAKSAADISETKLLQKVWATFISTGSVATAHVGWKASHDVSGFPNHHNTFVIRDLDTSVTVKDYKASTCATLKAAGFNQNFWWVN